MRPGPALAEARGFRLQSARPVFLLAAAIGVGGYFTIATVVESAHDQLLDGSLMAIAERLAVGDNRVTDRHAAGRARHAERPRRTTTSITSSPTTMRQ